MSSFLQVTNIVLNAAIQLLICTSHQTADNITLDLVCFYHERINIWNNLTEDCLK